MYCLHWLYRCQEQVEGNVKELVSKMLDAEKEEWSDMQPPEQDVDGAYYTTIGITLFQMIEQNVTSVKLYNIMSVYFACSVYCRECALDPSPFTIILI